MFRFFMICGMLALGCILGVVVLGQFFYSPKATGQSSTKVNPESSAKAPPDSTQSTTPLANNTPEGGITTIIVKAAKNGALPLIIADARVLPLEVQSVPCERDGKLLVVGTPVKKGESVPPEKRMLPIKAAFLGIKTAANDPDAEKDWIDPAAPEQRYRRPRPEDTLAPGNTRIFWQDVQFRKIGENESVEPGQILGVINPAVAREEVLSKREKLEVSLADKQASESTQSEAIRRLAMMQKAVGRLPGAIAQDEIGMAIVNVERYKAETIAKQGAIGVAGRELSAAWTMLDQHLIRASIPGRIKAIYRSTGDAVKNLEPVIQIQNSRFVKVEAQLPVQDALPLRKRLREGQKMRAEANALARKAEEMKDKAESEKLLASASALREQARLLLKVNIEVSRPDSPVASLSGHLQQVNTVAFSRGPKPKIVSGCEHGALRVWEQNDGEERWHEVVRLNHPQAIRSIATSGAKAERDLVATGSSQGTIRVFELDRIKEKDSCLTFSSRHAGAVNYLSFNHDGTLLVTGGADRSICLWDAKTGELLAKKLSAHKQAVTEVMFTPEGKIFSAGQDNRIVIWTVEGDKEKSLTLHDEISGRSGEVTAPGIDEKGENVLFDAGNELRVLNVASRQIVGTLSSATGNFSTMAQFSPDGKMILTNGNGPGKLQLWRSPSSTNRAAEMRQLLWSTGTVTSGAFDPSGQYAVTGTSDHRVLVWRMPRKEEAEKPMVGELSFVEDFQEIGLKRITIRATLENPKDDVVPGSTASIIIPPQTK